MMIRLLPLILLSSVDDALEYNPGGLKIMFRWLQMILMMVLKMSLMAVRASILAFSTYIAKTFHTHLLHHRRVMLYVLLLTTIFNTLLKDGGIIIIVCTNLNIYNILTFFIEKNQISSSLSFSCKLPSVLIKISQKLGG